MKLRSALVVAVSSLVLHEPCSVLGLAQRPFSSSSSSSSSTFRKVKEAVTPSKNPYVKSKQFTDTGVPSFSSSSSSSPSLSSAARKVKAAVTPSKNPYVKTSKSLPSLGSSSASSSFRKVKAEASSSLRKVKEASSSSLRKVKAAVTPSKNPYVKKSTSLPSLGSSASSSLRKVKAEASSSLRKVKAAVTPNNNSFRTSSFSTRKTPSFSSSSSPSSLSSAVRKVQKAVRPKNNNTFQTSLYNTEPSPLSISEWSLPSSPWEQPSASKTRKDRIKAKISPSSNSFSSRSSSSMSSSPYENELGAQPPLQFWDPLGLSRNADQAQFDRFRYCELKHGRVAMLAVVGYLVQEAGVRLPGTIDKAGNVPFRDIPNGLEALQVMPDAGIAQIVIFIGVLELAVMKDLTGGEFIGDFRNDFIDFGWDTFDEETKWQKRGIELNNGRAAQMGFLALIVHEKLGNLDAILPSVHGSTP